jgi:hypothetical protein
MRIEKLPSPGLHSRAISLRTLCASVISTFEVSARGYPSNLNPNARKLGDFFTACANAAYAISTPVAPANSVLPAITGTAQVGQTLTRSTGTWSGSPTYATQWFAAGVAIVGATAATYVPVVGDIGKVITVRVTATNLGGSTQATSAATAAVIAA